MEATMKIAAMSLCFSLFFPDSPTRTMTAEPKKPAPPKAAKNANTAPSPAGAELSGGEGAVALGHMHGGGNGGRGGGGGKKSKGGGDGASVG